MLRLLLAVGLLGIGGGIAQAEKRAVRTSAAAIDAVERGADRAAAKRALKRIEARGVKAAKHADVSVLGATFQPLANGHVAVSARIQVVMSHGSLMQVVSGGAKVEGRATIGLRELRDEAIAAAVETVVTRAPRLGAATQVSAR